MRRRSRVKREKGFDLRSDGLPRTMTVEEACSWLRWSRSKGYREAARGNLPTIRVGRTIRVPTQRLLEFLGEAG
jgi:excisionase family DNA binding protein